MKIPTQFQVTHSQKTDDIQLSSTARSDLRKKTRKRRFATIVALAVLAVPATVAFAEYPVYTPNGWWVGWCDTWPNARWGGQTVHGNYYNANYYHTMWSWSARGDGKLHYGANGPGGIAYSVAYGAATNGVFASDWNVGAWTEGGW